MDILPALSLCICLVISLEVSEHRSSKVQNNRVTSISKAESEKDSKLHPQSENEQINNTTQNADTNPSKSTAPIQNGSLFTTDYLFQIDKMKKDIVKSPTRPNKIVKLLQEKEFNFQLRTYEGSKTTPENLSDHRDSFNCGRKCLCTYDNHNFVHVNCTFRNYQVFPQNLPVTTKKLNASRNGIKTLNISSIVQLQNLQTLAIRSNEIKRIVVDTSKTSHLSTLDLAYNQIEKLEDEMLSFFPNLKNITLQFNRLKYIGNHSLSKMTQLRFLDLSNNPILTFDSAAFNSLTNLTELSLYGNKFLGYSRKHFPPSLFDKLNKLKILSIQGNSYGQIYYPIDALARIKSLQKLNIDILRNSIFLGPEMLALKQLKSLEFGPYSIRCHLHTLPANFFQYVPYIQTLSFNGCKFFNIEGNPYSLLPNLKSLSLINMKSYDLSQACHDLRLLQNSSLHVLRLVYLRSPQHEAPCISLKGIHSKYMSHLPLFHLDLSNNRIAIVQRDFIQGLPKTLQTLVIKYNLLTLREQIWDRMSSLKNLTHLDVSVQNLDSRDMERESSRFQNIENSYGEDEDLKSTGNNNSSLSCSFTAPQSLNTYNEINTLGLDQTNLYHDYEMDNNAVDVDNEIQAKTDCHRLTNKHLNLPEKLQHVKADHYFLFGDIIFSHTLSKNNLTHLFFSNSLLTRWGEGKIPLRVKFLDLSQNFCRYLNRNFFRQNNSLTHISLSSNMLGAQFSTVRGGHYFYYLKHTKFLDISLNFIYYLPFSFLKGLVSLKTLQMTDNRLQILNISFSETPELEMLDVRRNSISWISKQTREDLDQLASRHKVTLVLRHNPLPCTCGGIEIMKWLEMTNVHLLDQKLLQCFDEHGQLRNITDIRSLNKILQRQCMDKVKIIISGIASVSFFVVIVVSYYVGKRYRWWFYVKYKKNVWIAKWFGFRPKGSILPATEYRYDAYVCYSENDRNLAIEFYNTLNTNQLFIPDKDILYGTSEVSGMTSGIINSYKFLILLTENFKQDIRTHFKHNGMLEYTINMALFEERSTKRRFLHVVQFTNTDQVQIPLYLAAVLQDNDRQTTFPNNDAYASNEAIQCVWQSLSSCLAQHKRRRANEVELPSPSDEDL